MWFDVQQALTEIIGGTPPPSMEPPVTERPRVATVATVAMPLNTKRKTDPVDRNPYGTTFDGRPLTWTGRVISLDDWRRLTEWERHGPKGRHWCGLCRCWHHPGQCDGGTV